MFTVDPRPPAEDPAGFLEPTQPLLKPRARLARLRPVRLRAVQTRLREYERLGLGLQLLQQHFPAALAEYSDLSGQGWWQVLAHLANLVEQAGWFQINWPVLNEAWSYWMNDPETEQGDHLAVFLHYIPLTLYGFSDTESLFEMPPMELLHALLAGCEIHAVSSNLLIEAELYDNLAQWTAADQEATWRLLGQIEADPGAYPEPVRWLPELARWACHRTGNVMLDQHFDPYQNGPWFRWREPDLRQVKTAWRRAQPVLAAGERLMNWYEADPSHLVNLANFMIYGDDCDDLTW